MAYTLRTETNGSITLAMDSKDDISDGITALSKMHSLNIMSKKDLQRELDRINESKTLKDAEITEIQTELDKRILEEEAK